MHEEVRSELELLKEKQRRLEKQLGLLALRVHALERGVATPEPGPETAASLEQSRATAASAPVKAFAESHEIAVPPVISTVVQASGGVGIEVPAQPTPILLHAPTPQEPKPQFTVAVAEPVSDVADSSVPPVDKSFEMRLGTYWLVRVGVVLVLTGLVFFGNLAYQNFISKLGPAGKVGLMYLAGAMMLGAGGWWQRRAAKESLKNYAQVLFAGGLALVYFTTYAAHHVERLRVIHNQALDGFLLLAWAGVIVWLADRKKSEVLALFAVGLAYYSSTITHVGSFTLYSNLILAVTAVFFLIRNRWAALSFGSLVATYGGYAFWRFYDGASWRWATPEEGLWHGAWFLICYWAIFTAAVFLSRHEGFRGEKRAGFLTVNNAAFLSLFLLTMLQVRSGGLWKVLVIQGGVLLLSAALARQYLQSDPLVKGSYLTQGLLLVTAGIITKFSGLQLSLLLAVESVILLNFGQRRNSTILLVGAYVTAGLSTFWAMDGMTQFEPKGLWLGMGIGALMLVNTQLAHAQRRENESVLRPAVSYFAGLALVIWWVVTWNNASRAQFPLIVAVEALALTWSVYLIRIREVSLLAQLVMLTGVWVWFVTIETTGLVRPWWESLLMIGVVVSSAHWWQRQKAIRLERPYSRFLEAVYSAVAIGLLTIWLGRELKPVSWLVVSAGLCVGISCYGAVTRAWFLTAFSQLLMVVSGFYFLLHVMTTKPGMLPPLAPIAVALLISFAAVSWLRNHTQVQAKISEPVLQLVVVYRWAAVVMSILWVHQYVPETHRVWVLSALGLALFAILGGRNPMNLLYSAGFTASSLALVWMKFITQDKGVEWLDLSVVAAVLGQQRLARRLPGRFPLDNRLHMGLIAIGSLTLWVFISRWVMQSVSGFILTATWSALALLLFGMGALVRERMYRWAGLGILACSLGRIVIFDVWKIETHYRILSFLALGIVLLVLGFVYNKYQTTIRKWM